jgi:protein arginine N-methyltransferase 1
LIRTPFERPFSLVLDEHRQYLADGPRVDAFRRAIAETLKPGDAVLDLGCGTGILGLLACQAGAGRVYAVDEGGMAEIARAIARANGWADRIVIVRGLSTEIELPEKVDVVVADQIGRFGFEAGLLEYFDDARRRFLKPGGALIPGALDLEVAPVECVDASERVAFWSRARVAGLDFSSAHPMAVNAGHQFRYQPDHLLATPARVASIDLDQPRPSRIVWELTARAERAGTLHGIGGWFSARLSKTVTMTNSPLAPRRIQRRNVFFPIDPPVDVERGAEFRIAMSVRPNDLLVSWRVEVRRAGGDPASPPDAVFDHATYMTGPA